MKLSFYLFLLCLLVSFTLQAQCPPGDLFFSIQCDIEDFVAQYPDCEELNGDLEIIDRNDILCIGEQTVRPLDLAPLANIRRIAGSLRIENVNSDYAAFDNLEYIGGNFTLFRVPSTSAGGTVFNHFNSLDTIIGDLNIIDNATTELKGFSALTEVNRVSISSNEDLTTIMDFDAVTGLDELSIRGNDQLLDIAAFNGLLTTRSIYITSGGLLDISGFSSLTTVTGSGGIFLGDGGFVIEVAPALSRMSGLSSLERAGYISFFDVGLADLDDLSSLKQADEFIIATTNLNPVSNLTSAGGLTAIDSIGKFTLNGLGALTTLGDLSSMTYTEELVIARCGNLTDISGLNNLEADNAYTLDIINNPNLSVCDEPWICNRLAETLDDVSISFNRPDCEKTEVGLQCGVICRDLVPSNLSQSPVPNTQNLTVTFDVTSELFNTPGNANYLIYHSDDGTLSSNDPLLVTEASDFFNDGETASVSITVTPPVVDGFIILLIDWQDDFSECNANNNLLVIEITTSCDDGFMNGEETDVDCGGPDCPACPTCDDGIMNGQETGIDCGGPDCQECPETCADLIVTNFTITSYFPNFATYEVTLTNPSDNPTSVDNYRFSVRLNDSPEFAGSVGAGPALNITDPVPPGGSVTLTGDIFQELSDYTYFITSVQWVNAIPPDCDLDNNISDIPINFGCTDPNAHNYDPTATVPQGCEDCDDQVQNGDETGVDCGGSLCGPCPPCADVVIDSIQDAAFFNNSGEVMLRVFYTNTGDVTLPANSARLQTYRSTDDQWDSGDPIAGVQFINANLAPGASGSTLVRSTFSLTDGNTFSHLIALVNWLTDVPECSPDQSETAVPINFGCTEPTAHNYDPAATVFDVCISCDNFCETCNDGVLNGDELAVDCGGTKCPPCTGDGEITELFFSEYIAGTFANKALEIYNGTNATVDLTGYRVEVYNNGRSLAQGPSNFVNLSGQVLSGDVYAIVNFSAQAEFQGEADLLDGFTVTSFTGDDAIALRKDGTIIDMIGTAGVDPGSAWTGGGLSTRERTLTRAAFVTAGRPAGFSDPSLEWIGFPVDFADSLGTHLASNSLLPIDLIRFTAATAEKDVVLSWASSREEGTEAYDIYRSSDGGRRFDAIQTVAAGNLLSGAVYDFSDRGAAILPASTLYYRLVARDFDGSSQVFGLVAVDLSRSGAQELRVQPNPVAPNAVVKLLGADAGAKVELVAMDGRPLTTLTTGGQGQLRVPSLLAGVYLLRLLEGERKGQLTRIIVR